MKKLRFKSAKLNVFDLIEKNSPLALDDCFDLGKAFVIRTGQEKDPHWCDAAETWIAAMAGLVAQYGDESDRNLQTVRELLTNPQKMAKAIELLQKSEACGGMLSRIGHQLQHFRGDELGSCLTTTNRFLRWLDSQAIAENTRTSSFDPYRLTKRKMTVYLVMPFEHARAQAPWLRMHISAMLRAVVRGGLQEKRLVHFIIDEMATIGRMEPIDDALDKFRSYGVRCQLYFQSLGQLKKCFPEGQEQTVLSNTTQIFFGVQDQQTAEYVSARLGDKTEVYETGGSSSGSSRQSSHGSSYSESAGSNRGESRNSNQTARRLLKTDEVINLSRRVAITLTPGLRPICTTLVRWFEEPWLKNRSGWIGRQLEALSILLRSLILLFAISVCAWLLTDWAKEQAKVQSVNYPVQPQWKGGKR